MLKFVAMQNVERFRAKLNNETHPERRILLQRLLVEEEDKLGATFELLASVQRAINDCRQQIAERFEPCLGNGCIRAVAMQPPLRSSRASFLPRRGLRFSGLPCQRG